MLELVQVVGNPHNPSQSTVNVVPDLRPRKLFQLSIANSLCHPDHPSAAGICLLSATGRAIPPPPRGQSPSGTPPLPWTFSHCNTGPTASSCDLGQSAIGQVFPAFCSMATSPRGFGLLHRFNYMGRAIPAISHQLSAFSLLPSAFCLLPPAFCLLPPASCLLLPAPRSLLPAPRSRIPTSSASPKSPQPRRRPMAHPRSWPRGANA